MSVQSNSGSGGGSLEATPSWSQLSSSPTISQPQITATAKSKEGTPAHPSARPARILPKVRSFPPREVDYFGRVELAFVQVKKMDVKFSDAVNWKPNVSCQFS